MNNKWIFVDVSNQSLSLFEGEKRLIKFPISTAKNGLGEIKDSEKTPRGWHCIEQKLGDGMPVNTVFISRKPTGEIYSDKLSAEFPTRDWILTRILWLGGMEEAKNRGGEVDTFSRYIYIHGCPDKISFAHPSSHGCIRMHNQDLLSLFDVISEKTLVYIGEKMPANLKEYLS